MAIQYPKKEHITLGSVEGWGTDMNILRDPPKSISTRRIDKVGQTSDITNIIDSSSDRASEAINLYARGVNPMVSVSYGNYGANGGRVGELTTTSHRAQPRYPYPIMEGGAFRPPVRGPLDLLPLSRLPRAKIADVMSGIDLPDYSKTSQYIGELRAIKDVLNAYDITPNKKGSISKNLVENFKMDNAINDKHINVDVSSGIRSRDISSYTRDHVDVYKGVNDDVLNAFAISNISKGDGVQTLENFQIDENNYIQEHTSYDAYSNLSKNNIQDLSNVHLDTNKFVQEHTSYDTYSNLSKNNIQDLSNVHLDTNKFVQEHTSYDAYSNLSKNNIQDLSNVHLDTNKFVQEHTSYDAYSNMSKETTQNLSHIDFDTSKYIQDGQVIETFTNLSSDINTKTLDELVDIGRVSVKDNVVQFEKNAGFKPNRTFLNEIAQHNPHLEMRNPQFGVDSQKSDSTVYKRVEHENEIKYDRNRPMPSVTANITKIEDFNSINLSSRNYRLEPTLRKGSFVNDGIKPTINRPDLVSARASRESDKDKIRSKFNEQQFSRFKY